MILGKKFYNLGMSIMYNTKNPNSFSWNLKINKRTTLNYKVDLVIGKKSIIHLIVVNAGGGFRTHDLQIMSIAFYGRPVRVNHETGTLTRLSYPGMFVIKKYALFRLVF